MKELIIVRHGKSSRDIQNIKDIDRPLKRRGIDDAHDMAERLVQSSIKPDLLLSSPANRALHTATIFCRVLKLSFQNLHIDPVLYFSYEEEIIQLIQNCDDDINSLMLVGHNPTFTDVVNQYLINPVYELPTSGVVIMKFKCDSWKSIGKDNIIAEIFDYPKNNGQ